MMPFSHCPDLLFVSENNIEFHPHLVHFLSQPQCHLIYLGQIMYLKIKCFRPPRQTLHLYLSKHPIFTSIF
jgi:hypothetical protein